MILVIIGALIIIGISVIWVRGVDYMEENYPDYRGEDLFNENQSYEKDRNTEESK